MKRLPTPQEINRAKAFLLAKWRERARQQGQPDPADLRNACKFASLFAQGLFGGKILGNYHHLYVTARGKTICLTDAAGVDPEDCPDPYYHDPAFWDENEEVAKALDSCRPRVNEWLREYRLTHKKGPAGQ